MRLNRLSLLGFRNYRSADICWHPGLNLLVGENAQGKTNLLEAICLLALGRSPRTARTADLVHWDESSFHVQGQVESQGWEKTLQFSFTRPARKEILINGNPQSRVGDLLGGLLVVYFGPEDLELIKGGPDMRRRFLDVLLCQLSPSYYQALRSYRRTLMHRNALLKERHINDEAIGVWDSQLAASGSLLISRRALMVRCLESIACGLHANLSGQREQLGLQYRPALSGKDKFDLSAREAVAHRLAQDLQARRNEEQQQRTTLVGPHRDELLVLLNQRSLRVYGSQGQQRTAALSMKMAEIDAMREATGDTPVLLLDDVLSELDAQRRHWVRQAWEDGIQIFVAGTDEKNVIPEGNRTNTAKLFFITGGKVESKP